MGIFLNLNTILRVDEGKGILIGIEFRLEDTFKHLQKTVYLRAEKHLISRS